MNKFSFSIFFTALLLLTSHSHSKDIITKGKFQNYSSEAKPFKWQNATVYFLLTDRFKNGDKKNDFSYGRKNDAAIARGFLGGDLKGIIQKINSGYFTQLGVNVIWLTPPVEQIHGSTDEGTGKSYAFHGYWAKDFTRVDANYGTNDDFATLVKTAHEHGIRVLLDVVLNHLGPVTDQDPTWSLDWVRTSPACDYKSEDGAIKCTLVKNLPDFLTESNQAVELPLALVNSWKQQGRYDQEVKELNAFFERTSLPKFPRNYLIKWQTDWIRKYGVDGFRVDTVKHVEASVWAELKHEASIAYEEWKLKNPKKRLGNEAFYMTAEAYNYAISDGLEYKMDGGTLINYFNNGFDSMINFGFKSDANQDYESLFRQYSQQLNGPLKKFSVLNYIDSHDDGHPFDADRKRVFESATKLMLTPGAVQIYYGDELARPLQVKGAIGDANLRSMMNWSMVNSHKKLPSPNQDKTYAKLLKHWQKLGQFRQKHIAVGTGIHQKMNDSPYIFSRIYDDGHIQDKVVVALDMPIVKSHTIFLGSIFGDGQILKEYYSGQTVKVKNSSVTLSGLQSVILLGKE
jgi:alpha-amylase